MYDICIIGAGVIGMNIARELAKYKLKICVLEKNGDVACGSSKANSGIVHGGYADQPGTLKAKLCAAGNRMYEALDAQLHFGYRKTGALVLAFQDEEVETLRDLYERGVRNGVEGLRLIDGKQAAEREPYVNREVKAALASASVGVTSPYEFVIALAENAVANGVAIELEQEVRKIQPCAAGFEITTGKTAVTAHYVINAAGMYADAVSRMAGISKYRITPRQGQYIIMDKTQNYLVNSVIFQAPTKMGKGVLVTTTYHGNLMIGPNASDVAEKEDVGTDLKTLENITRAARKSIPEISLKYALKSFAGNRPVSNEKDWVIEESEVKGFFQLIGVDSPGLTAAPAIALEVVGLLKRAGLKLIPKEDFQSNRPPIIQKKGRDFKGSVEAEDPRQRIICRCETVTEAEIVDCLHRGLPVCTLDAVARRTRAGFGRCQGAFCGPRVRSILAAELGVSPEEIQDQSNAASDSVQRVKRPHITKI